MISRERSWVLICHSPVLDAHLDNIALETHVVRLDGLECRQLYGRSRPDVETSSMARTLDLRLLELALVERAAVVCAQIVDGVELAVHVAHGHVVVADREDRHALGRDLRSPGDGVPGGHPPVASRSRTADQIASSRLGSASLLTTDWKKPSTISCSAAGRSRPRLCR